jgi:hypothetical protein
MARDDSSGRDPEEELRMATAEVARLTAENETLRDVVSALLDEVTPAQFGRARARLDALDEQKGKEAGHDEPSV